MIVLSGEVYDKKCAKVADACASVTEAHEEFVNFLTAIGDIDLEDPELHKQAQLVGKLMLQAKKSLETF